MPEAKRVTVADVGEGVLTGMHPVINEKDEADVILTPDDLMQRNGFFLKVDHNGNPEGFTLGQPPKLVGRNLYMGTSPNQTTKQNTVLYLPHESSALFNQPLVEGEAPPDDFSIGLVPKPEQPIIQTLPVSVVGFPEGTAEHPYYMAWTANRQGKHTKLSPPVKVPPLATGQSIRFKPPESLPTGATHIGIWLTQPGSSTPSSPGEFRLQLNERFSRVSGELELNGPYTYALDRPGDTSLPSPERPASKFISERYASRPGIYLFAMTSANELGESLLSPLGHQHTVVVDARLGEENPAGYGYFRISRGTLPLNARGWYLYCLVGNQWHKVYDKTSGAGLTKPLPLNQSVVETKGWTGSEFWAQWETWLLSSAQPPTENTTGVENPDSPLEEPTVFGGSRPAPGIYYARVNEEYENDEISPISDATRVVLPPNEVPRIVFANATNRLPNATLVEKAGDGLPLGYTVTQTGGLVTLDNGELTMETTGVQAGATPEVLTAVIEIDRDKEWSVGGFIKVEDPRTLGFQGTFEVVLREIGSSNTDTILKSITSVGEHRYYSVINPSGFSGLAWQDDTLRAQILYRFSGASKNMVAKISRQLLKDYLYGFRRRESGEGASNPNPPPETTAPPIGAVAVEPSPAPEISPEVSTQVSPDRPSSSGMVEESVTLESGMPAWTQNSTNATLAREAGAALAGSWGLAARKTSGGSSGSAYLSKTFPVPAGLVSRHAMGISAKFKVPTLPVNGSITLAELRSIIDGKRYAWLDLDTRSEVAQLEITASPQFSGNIVTSLDEAGMSSRNTAVVATREEAQLTIEQDPTSDGLVSANIGGISITVPVVIEREAVAEVVELEITQGASGRGQIAFYIENPEQRGGLPSHSIIEAIVEAGASPDTVASKLREHASTTAWQNAPWIISGSGRFVRVTCKVSNSTGGNHFFRSATAFSSRSRLGETGVQTRITILTHGQAYVAPDTTVSVAQRLKSSPVEGYTSGGTPGTPSVTWMALEPGPKADASYSDNGTGATGTMTTTTQGALDSPEAVATKVASTYSGNTYWTASASGTKVTLSATSIGAKVDATFSPGTTGVTAKMKTLIQGSSDIVAYAEDAFGVKRQRRVLPNITNTSVFNIDLPVSGAGTPESGLSSAVVSAWGSTGSSTKTLRALFEDVNLREVDVGAVAIGVTSESSNSLTWEVHVDEIKVTNRGETYYHYHDDLGELINQLHLSLPPNQPQRDDLYLQDWRQAVLPDTEYTAGVWVRWAGVVGDIPSDDLPGIVSEPFYLYCLTPQGERKSILIDGEPRDEGITGGLQGTGDWTHFEITFTTPPDCYEMRLESRGIGAGEIVSQELADSLGVELKRTPFYATNGSYVATLDIGTPFMFDNASWSRERKLLEADVDVPLGASATISYQAAEAKAGPFDLAVSDPDLVKQKDVIRMSLQATGNGLLTPTLRSGSPRAEYVLMHRGRPLPTLLKEDRTELPGGAAFASLNEHSDPLDVVLGELPGGRVSRAIVYGPVGAQPSSSLMVFTPEARKFIEDRAYRGSVVDFVIEAWGHILTVRPKGGIRFERQAEDVYMNDRRYNWYIGELPECEVISVRDLPA